jgi:uncharacterized protein (TIGR02145 family)
MSLKGKQLFLCFYLLLFLFKNDMMGQVMSNYIRLEGEVLEKKASFNLEEIKVRWKKAALENCSGVPCVMPPTVPPPPPLFTCGTSTVTDTSGNIYHTVLIGTNCWTKENLKVRRYNNGTEIRFDQSGTSVGNVGQTWAGSGAGLKYGAYTLNAHDSTATPSNLTKYGYLYNWYAAKGISRTGVIPGTDTLNICPKGWHVPSDVEWTILKNHLGTNSGGKMKSTSPLWFSASSGTDNSSGFSALPGGIRFNDGLFDNISYQAVFWSATEKDDNVDNAWSYDLEDWSDDLNPSYGKLKSYGASLRCIKN